jgi:hypothetical protein
MVLKGFRSAINHQGKPGIWIGSQFNRIIEPFVSSIKTYDIIQGMPNLNCQQVVLLYGNATIIFPKTKNMLQCFSGIEV